MDSSRDIKADKYTYDVICQEFLDEVNTYKDQIKKGNPDWEKKVIKSVEVKVNNINITKHKVTQYIYKPSQDKDDKRKCWVRRVDEVSKVETWTYTSNDADDKKFGRVGTDGRAIIKYVDHDANDFVSTQGFIDRGILVCETMLHKSITDTYFKTLEQSNKLKDGIEKIKLQFIEKIWKQCWLDPKKLEEDGFSYFAKQREKAEELIAELIVYFASEMQKNDEANRSLEELVTVIEASEKLQVHDRGRPAYIKVGQFREEYDLVLMSSLPTNNTGDIDTTKAEKGKIYLKDGAYLLLDSKGQVQTGKIDNKTIPMDNLAGRLNDQEFKSAILKATSEAGHTITMLSAQFPRGKQTVPSTIRYRESEDGLSRLSNNVDDVTGQVVVNKKGKNKVIPLVEIIGHSSYPPITVTDKLLRRNLTYQAVLENITQIVEKQLREENGIPATKTIIIDGGDGDEDDDSDEQTTPKNKPVSPPRILQPGELGTKEKPIPLKKLSLSSMMLLTPLRKKYIDSILRGSESEVNQLSESAMALDMVRYRLNKALPLEINGTFYKVEIDLSCMNIPVNMGKFWQNVSSEAYFDQQRINARGIYDYHQTISGKLQQTKRTEDNTLYNQVQNVLSKLNEDPQLTQLIAKHKPVLDGHEAALSGQHAICLFNLNEYERLSKPPKASCSPGEKEKHSKDKDQARKNYEAARDLIVKTEKRLHEDYYAIINAERKKLFNQNKATIDNLQTDINTALDPNNTINDQDREYYILLQRFLRAQDMYYNETYKEDLYHLQANYLLSLKQAGVSIETFCKSAEDRTGWLRVTLFAYEEFKLKYGHNPKMPEDADKYKLILPKALQLSASIQNTLENSGAQGIQGSSSTTGLKDSDISNSMGTLAKGVIDRAKTIAAWRDPSFKRIALLTLAVGCVIGAGILITVFTFGAGLIPYALGVVGIAATTTTVAVAGAAAVSAFSGFCALVVAGASTAGKSISRKLNKSTAAPSLAASDKKPGSHIDVRGGGSTGRLPFVGSSSTEEPHLVYEPPSVTSYTATPYTPIPASAVGSPMKKQTQATNT